MEGSESLARELRGHGRPVLLLTEKESDGALAKPFRLGALLARLAAQLGPHGMDEDRPVAIGPYLFLPGAKLLTGARMVRLTEKETNILKFLHAAGDTVPRETLLHEVWGVNYEGQTHYLRVYMAQLRQKLERDSARPRFLLTEPGVGYRLITRD